MGACGSPLRVGRGDHAGTDGAGRARPVLTRGAPTAASAYRAKFRPVNVKGGARLDGRAAGA